MKTYRRHCLAAMVLTSIVAPSVMMAGMAHADPAPSPSGSMKGVEQIQLTDERGKPALQIPSASPSSRAQAQPAGALSTGQLTGKKFSTLGLSWKKDSPVDKGTTVRARFHKAGKWGAWQYLPMELEDSVTDAAKRAGAPSYFAGDADGVELAVSSDGKTLPQDLRLSMINPEQSVATPQGKPNGQSSPTYAPRQPFINTRAGWGADESIADPGYKLQPVIKAATIHHTVTGNNNYSRADVPKIINGIYVDLITGRGYGDFPYHFVVDRFGGIWEGRKGSIAMKPDSDIPGILGGHAMGFNTGTFGIAALGNFEPNNSESGQDTGPNPKPSRAMKHSLKALLAWKLSQYGLDAEGKVELTSAGGGGTNPHPAGTPLNVDVINTHQDLNVTACPGQSLHNFLPKLRHRVAQRMN